MLFQGVYKDGKYEQDGGNAAGNFRQQRGKYFVLSNRAIFGCLWR